MRVGVVDAVHGDLLHVGAEELACEHRRSWIEVVLADDALADDPLLHEHLVVTYGGSPPARPGARHRPRFARSARGRAPPRRSLARRSGASRARRPALASCSSRAVWDRPSATRSASAAAPGRAQPPPRSGSPHLGHLIATGAQQATVDRAIHTQASGRSSTRAKISSPISSSMMRRASSNGNGGTSSTRCSSSLM